jgi:hypothetical protein
MTLGLRSVEMRIAVALSGLMGMIPAASAADYPTKAPAAEPATLEQRWNVTFASEARYFSWRGDRGTPASASITPGGGSQIYTPFALSVVGRPNDNFKVEFFGRGGWVKAEQTTAGLSGSVDTPTDTVVSSTITYLGVNGFQPFLSASGNLPSGKSVLTGNQVFARMDSDLVEIGSFGEGYNYGPAAGFSWSITENLIFTASAGYTWREPFERDRSSSATAADAASLTTINPGDVFTGTASIGFSLGRLSAKLLGSLSEETKTVENGLDLYKPGRRYLASGTFSYDWEAFGVATLTASMSHSQPNDVRFLGASALVTETMNTNSNLYRIGLQHLFVYKQVAFGPAGSFLYRDQNGYDSTTFQFLPAKERWTAGGIARYAASDNVTFNFRGDWVWTREDDHPANGAQQFSVLANAFVAGSAVPVISSTGWQIAAGANVRF